MRVLSFRERKERRERGTGADTQAQKGLLHKPRLLGTSLGLELTVGLE